MHGVEAHSDFGEVGLYPLQRLRHLGTFFLALGTFVLARRGAKVLAAAGLDTDPARLRDQVVGQLLDGMTGPPHRSD